MLAALPTACATDKPAAANPAPPPPSPAPVMAATFSPEPIAAMVPGAAVDFHSSVQPFLAQYCYECHGATEQKHEIRFDLRESAMTHRGLILAGNPGRSALVRVLNLPPANDEHMPPSDKPQPTADEIAMIRQWIAEGAHWPAARTSG